MADARRNLILNGDLMWAVAFLCDEMTEDDDLCYVMV